MTPPPQPHHPSTGGGVEEGPTLDLSPERRFTGEYHNDPRVGARPVDCSAPQVVLPPLCRSSTSRGPRHTAPALTASERQMERAARRRVPLMTFGSGLPCGLARSPIVFPSPLQAQPHHQHHPAPRRGVEERPTLDLHTERAAHRRVPLMTFGPGLVWGLARSSGCLSSPLQGQHQVQIPHAHTNTTPAPVGGGEEGPTLDHRSERAAHRRVPSMTSGPGLVCGLARSSGCPSSPSAGSAQDPDPGTQHHQQIQHPGNSIPTQDTDFRHRPTPYPAPRRSPKGFLMPV
ncbi:hypothetical protein DPEC_G00343230 [Dallia pectoralis]|uniref:Uncharacterized protein n=1 Tax=Dallia pectoralis TaxID=75939 RepID=A0ACC2F2Y3_DALPE|nr:hypothetical protein DPEC_G00343230 [Dallia pectoralis]